MALQDYKDIVAFLASVFTIGQFFSGVFICKNIIRQKNTNNVQVTPFLGGIGMSFLFLRYAFIINDMAMLPVNYMGILLNVGYFLVFAYYSDQKVTVATQFSKVMLGTLVILLYTFLEDPKNIEYRYGVITTILMLTLIASPFLQLGEVLRTKSTESLPFPLILSGTAVSFLWLLYGLIIEDPFMQFQNAVGFMLSVAQLSLFAIFPSKSADAKKIQKKKKN